MGKLTDIFMKGVAPAQASELDALLLTAEAEQATLLARQQALTSDRLNALLGDDDAVVDRIEADLTAVQRALDRNEIRIPELKRRLAEQRTIEQRLTNERDFKVALRDRLAAANRIDGALADFGEALRNFEASGVALAGLQHFHRASTVGNGLIGQCETDPSSMRCALAFHARGLLGPLGIGLYGGENPAPLGATEAAFWALVEASIVSRTGSNGGEA